MVGGGWEEEEGGQERVDLTCLMQPQFLFFVMEVQGEISCLHGRALQQVSRQGMKPEV